jgi:NADPH:quinone reductase-like Zn-dependent oxidoreductase
MKFPVFSLLAGNLGSRDGFARDCLLQRRVSCEPDFPCSRCHLILVKNISVIGVVWGAQAERDPALISRNLAELLRWREAGRLEPLVAKVFPLPEAGEALTALLSRRYAGKIVLET